MKQWKIPVVWTMMGSVEVEAETLAEAIEIARDENIPDNGEYLDGSWEVDYEDENFSVNGITTINRMREENLQ